jgi:hypothetical protein
MASAGLLHPQVNVDFNAVEDQIMRGEYRPDANDQPLQTLKAIISRISEVWPKPPPHDHLHVFVGLPVEVDNPTDSGVWFFFLLVLGMVMLFPWTVPCRPPFLTPKTLPWPESRREAQSRKKTVTVEEIYNLFLSRSHIFDT